MEHSLHEATVGEKWNVCGVGVFFNYTLIGHKAENNNN